MSYSLEVIEESGGVQTQWHRPFDDGRRSGDELNDHPVAPKLSTRIIRARDHGLHSERSTVV